MVDFVLRISFADPAAAGWDPSVTLIEPCVEGEPVQYDIVVRSQDTMAEKTFRTKRMISSIAADALRGRGTRVWEVVELDDDEEEIGDTTCALKDAWVDNDRTREGAILDAIRKSTKGKPDSRALLEGLNMFLLTTVAYGDVYLNDRVDTTRPWSIPAIVNLLSVKNEPEEHGRVKSHLAPMGGIALEPVPHQPATQHFATKSHHRIVFEEVGMTIREVQSLREVFTYIHEAILGR